MHSDAFEVFVNLSYDDFFGQFLAWLIDLKYLEVFPFANVVTLFILSLFVFKNRNIKHIQKNIKTNKIKILFQFNYVTILKFILLLIDIWVIFEYFAIINSIQRTLHIGVFGYSPVTISLGYIPRNGNC